MKNIPYVLIKSAMTLDGYIDDATNKRLLISNARDFEDVEKIRESCDAILVGAETIRKDNPKLVLKSGKRLTKVTITTSGNLNPKSNFFTLGNSEKIIYTTASASEKLKKEIPNATVVAFSEDISLQQILEDLFKRGVKKLLIEGGSTIITEFLKEELVDEMQISIAPIILGDKGGAKINKKLITKNLELKSEKKLDEMIVLTYKQNNDDKWIKYAIELSKKCPTSDTAFAVGAALVDKNGNLIADGYSKELDPKNHAEEAVFTKIKNKNFDLSETTLYSSLEPCSQRKSKPESCTDLILKSSIKRIAFAAKEPLIFAKCDGEKRLVENKKTVTYLSGYENEIINKQSKTIQKLWRNTK